MQLLIAAILTAALPAAALAQAPAQPRSKPAAAKPVAAKAAPTKAPGPQAAAPRLSEADLEVAKKVHVGEIACELGAKVSVTAMPQAGFFLLKVKAHEFVMHPVESRTGAIRLEDPARGAVWLQLGNKSMLMSQKLGQRLADECQSPDQVAFAEEMKKRPPINLLEPAPSAGTTQPAAAPPQPAAAVASPVAPAAAIAAEPLPAAAPAPSQ